MTRFPYRFLVRFSGDLGTKRGRAFIQFRSRLSRNLKDALQRCDIPFSLQTTRGRLYVNAGEPGVESLLERVFGIQSFSPVHTRPFTTLDDVVKEGERQFADRVSGRTFAVRARRSSIRDSVDFTSEDIERRLGARLLPRSAGVDLSHPEATARIELTREGAHYFDDIVSGPGGLPIGSGGRSLTLVSGGIDSVVAAWLMLKRGLEQDYVFYNLGDAEHLRQVTEIVRVLAERWSYGSRPRIWVFDLRPWVEQLRERTPTELWQVLLKRLMVLGAQEIAAKAEATALVTGESLGQVSSQTLANLAVIEGASALPILRPLVGFDKAEIIELARRVGTFELSARVHEYCALQGRGPTIGAEPEAIAASESRLDLTRLRQAIEKGEPLDLTTADSLSESGEALGVDTVPKGSTVIDLRPAPSFANWHYPGAVRLDYAEALATAEHVERGRTYVVCCEVEFKSAHVAETMRAAGCDASYFRGGTGRLLRYAADREMVAIGSVAPAVREG